MQKKTALKTGAAALVLASSAIGGMAFASAAPPASKVTICHRTASHTNPYVRITVAQDSVDGNLANDHGQGDHYREHLGPIGPIAHGEWGDIIPPIAGVHGGLNWSADGMRIWAAGCDATPSVTTTTSTTTTVYAT